MYDSTVNAVIKLNYFVHTYSVFKNN